jgi:Helix-turn-helix domain
MRDSQLQRIVRLLRHNGKVSRNECISLGISFRLAARIDDLKRQGWEFSTKEAGGDFTYHVALDPGRVTRDHNPDHGRIPGE